MEIGTKRTLIARVAAALGFACGLILTRCRLGMAGVAAAGTHAHCQVTEKTTLPLRTYSS